MNVTTTETTAAATTTLVTTTGRTRSRTAVANAAMTASTAIVLAAAARFVSFTPGSLDSRAPNLPRPNDRGAPPSGPGIRRSADGAHIRRDSRLAVMTLLTRAAAVWSGTYAAAGLFWAL